ncbi:MAG: UDP-N-acetylmuramoyl-L-alanyl-D-glutamate--2,6-diaminopimelate ligase [Leptospiraceae bacterium]|nr:UDP-N-acetylmuramoyl-L-alanyl-D-glutamate--2,6-diaminopimelate ligase [Leptospiraceae bacterium]
MNLHKILEAFPSLKPYKVDSSNEVNYLQADSRKISAKDIFVVYSDFEEKAAQYVQDAIQRGAGHILFSEDTLQKLSSLDLQNINIIIHKNPRRIHGKLASFLLGNPSQSLKIFAVTGTNGKTSTTHILYHFLKELGKSVGLIGTINVKYNNVVYDVGYTTPDPSSLNQLLYEMKKANVEYVVMEASSHGLKLGRLEGIDLDAGIFTNLTPDHLDFHITMEDYFLSKFHLFELLQTSSKTFKVGIVNLYAEYGKRMKELIEKLSPNFRTLYFGGNKIEGKLKNLSLNGTDFSIQILDFHCNLSTRLLGEFNVENLSLAILLIKQFFPNLTCMEVQKILSTLKPIPGRFELIYPKNKDRVAIVDYAHTPDALENLLKSVRQIPHSKLITIFGCGGDRDKKKRPLMGAIAAKFSDFVILTSDNPRTENPETILDEIQTGFPLGFQNYYRIENRREAIQKGIEILPSQGILVIAGKGHENYQIVGKEKYPFSDVEEINKIWYGEEN